MNNIDSIAFEAKSSTDKLEVFIKDYERFILSSAAEVAGHFVDKSDDEWSVALWSFYEAVQSYDSSKGHFLGYAKMLIRSRMIDHYRSQSKLRSQVSLELVEENDLAVEAKSDEIRMEIEALEQTLHAYGFEVMDLVNSSPKAEKTRQACRLIVRFMLRFPLLIEDMRKTKLLPIKLIEQNTQIPRKVMERHRKYIVTAVEILYDDYPHLREYFHYIWREENP